jgi:hypothetical protein
MSSDRNKLLSLTSTYRAINLHIVPPPPPPHGESNSLVPSGSRNTGPGFSPTDSTRSTTLPTSPSTSCGLVSRLRFIVRSPLFPLRPLSSSGGGIFLFSCRAQNSGPRSSPLYPPFLFCFSSRKGGFIFRLQFFHLFQSGSLFRPLPFLVSFRQGAFFVLFPDSYSRSFPFYSPSCSLCSSRRGNFMYCRPRRKGPSNRLLITRETA